MKSGGLLALALLLLAASGCASNSSGAPLGKPQVVASFYPLAEVAAVIGGPSVHVENLTPPGTEPHDVELTSRQVDRIHDADVVLYLGLGFQPAVERAVKQRDGQHRQGSIDVLAKLGDAKLHGTDPHVWLDPKLMGDIATIVEQSLPAKNQQAADTYRGDLDALDHEFRNGLALCQREVIVTGHEAFGYLAAEYGLTQDAIAGLSPESEPDANRIAKLADDIKRTGATTVFTEALVSPKVAQALAREAHVTTATLDPLEGLTTAEQRQHATYFTVMRDNLATLRTALGCR